MNGLIGLIQLFSIEKKYIHTESVGSFIIIIAMIYSVFTMYKALS